MSDIKCKKLNEGKTCPYFHESKYEDSNMVCRYGEFINKNKCYMETDKKIIKQEIKNSRGNKTNAQNIMECSEDWYDPYYAMSQVFSDDEIDNMTDREIDYILRLGYAMSEAFF